MSTLFYLVVLVLVLLDEFLLHLSSVCVCVSPRPSVMHLVSMHVALTHHDGQGNLSHVLVSQRTKQSM